MTLQGSFRLTTASLWLILLFAGSAGAEAPEVRFSPGQLRQDAAFLGREILESHPDLAHSVDPELLSSSLRSLEERLTEPLTRDEAWKLFATLNPLLADGHLFVGIPNWRAEAEAHLAQGGAFFPLEVYVSDDGAVLVKAALGGGETPHAGARLQSINGVDARVVSAELLARAHGDTPAFRAELVSRRWWFYYWKVYGAKEDFDLVFSGEQSASVRVPGSRMKPEFLAEEADFGAAVRDRAAEVPRRTADREVIRLGGQGAVPRRSHVTPSRASASGRADTHHRRACERRRRR